MYIYSSVNYSWVLAQVCAIRERQLELLFCYICLFLVDLQVGGLISFSYKCRELSNSHSMLKHSGFPNQTVDSPSLPDT